MSQGARTRAARVRMYLISLLAVCVAAITAVDAQAATSGSTYAYTTTFGTGDLTATGAAAPNALAVDPATGNILATDEYGARTAVFAPDPATGGSLLTSIDASGGNIVLPQTAAIDPTNGDLYLKDAQATMTVARYVSDGNPTPTYTLDMSWSLTPGAISDYSGGMAVDPTTHDLLVVEPSLAQIDRISGATGAVISTFNASGGAVSPFVYPTSIAAGPNGDSYVVDSTSRVVHLNASDVAQGELPGLTSPTAVAADPSNGAVAVADGWGVGPASVFGFSASGAPAYRAQVPPSISSASTRGMAIDGSTHRMYVQTDGSAVGVQVFDPAVSPGVDAPALSAITTEGAHVEASVAPGNVVTTAHFEYCLASADCSSYPAADPSDPSNPWHSLADHTGIAGGGQTTIQDDFTNLSRNTAYIARVIAANAATSSSASTPFRTAQSAPSVQTGGAVDITASSATVNGSITPYGLQTTFHFEYGTTTDYGSSVPVGAEAIAGGGTAARSFSRPVDGLAPGTTYHFRLVAQNAAGVTYGADQTFVTAAANQPGRGYEQVTPVDKDGADINSHFGFQAKADGSALEYSTLAAPADATSSPWNSRFLSVRGASDWTSGQQLDPPLSSTRAYTDSLTLAVSDDFTHALVATNRRLADGGEDGAANLYVRDVASNTYKYVASSGASAALATMTGLAQANMFLKGAPDFSWVVFASRVPLLPGVTGTALYRWSASGLQLVSTATDGSISSGNAYYEDQQVGAIRTVSDDGSRVYFTMIDGSQPGVYVSDRGQVRAISVSQLSGAPATPHVGQFVGASRDGRYAIFYSDQLTTDAPAGVASSLYQYDASNGNLKYLGAAASFGGTVEPSAVLWVSEDAQTVYFIDGANLKVWRNGAVHVISAETPPYAFSSPNGRYVAFPSYPDPGNSQFRDVHVYDSDTARLSCASCPQGGSPSAGDAALPENQRNISNRLPLAVNDAGGVFFDTAAQLVKADRNGKRDVYMFHDGSVTLISPGDAEYSARFADSSDSGGDVFFTTSESLVSRDVDQQTDIYDARVGGGLPAQSPADAAHCIGSECAEHAPGPTSSPPVTSPPSATTTPKASTNEVRVKVSISKVTFTAKAMHVAVHATGRGRIRVSGSRVVTTIRNVSKAGTYTVVVRLSRKAQSMHRAHRSFKVTARVSLTGGWGAASTAKISRTLGK